MPDLHFQIEAVEVVPFAAVPTISFRLKVRNASTAESVHSIALVSQIQIEAARRKYNPDEQKKLRDLFGEPGRWSQTLRSLLWTHVQTTVGAFEKETAVDLHVPLSFDFHIGATKYFYGVTNGEIPLLFQFSGSVFYLDSESALSVEPISWDKETKCRLPVSVWQEAIEAYYPNTAWLCLRRDIFDRLYEYKVRNGIATWEKALENMLAAAEETVQA